MVLVFCWCPPPPPPPLIQFLKCVIFLPDNWSFYQTLPVQDFEDVGRPQLLCYFRALAVANVKHY